MFRTLQNILKTPDLRNRILFTIGIIFVFRLLAHIPVPGVDTDALANLFQEARFYSCSTFLLAELCLISQLLRLVYRLTLRPQSSCS